MTVRSGSGKAGINGKEGQSEDARTGVRRGGEGRVKAKSCSGLGKKKKLGGGKEERKDEREKRRGTESKRSLRVRGKFPSRTRFLRKPRGVRT